MGGPYLSPAHPRNTIARRCRRRSAIAKLFLPRSLSGGAGRDPIVSDSELLTLSLSLIGWTGLNLIPIAVVLCIKARLRRS